MVCDTAEYQLLELIIPRILGECRGCNEPCKHAHGGHGHEDVCSCCKSYDVYHDEDDDE